MSTDTCSTSSTMTRDQDIQASLPPGFHDKYAVDPATGCWVWQGSKNSNGYGTVRNGGRMQYAHRVAYAYYRDDALPPYTRPGPQLDHLCRNRACCNPWHLELVSNRENVLRGTAPSAVNAKKTHCPRGHAYEGDNLYVTPGGQRQCRECNRERDREGQREGNREAQRRRRARQRADHAAAAAALNEWVAA